MTIYNQTETEYSKMGCTIYGLFNILKYTYGIKVKPNFIIKALMYFDKLWVWSPSEWAIFSIIYAAFIKALNSKLKLNFKVKKRYISSFNIWTDTFWIWVKNYNYIRKRAEKRGELLQEDIEKMKKYQGKTYYHHILWDNSYWGHFINSMGMKPFKCNLDKLKQLEKLWFTRNPMRTIVPNDKETHVVVSLTKNMRRAEMQGRLKLYLKTNKDNEYLKKAKEVYEYWK